MRCTGWAGILCTGCEWKEWGVTAAAQLAQSIVEDRHTGRVIFWYNELI